MTVLRLIARPLLAAAFLADGIDAVRHPQAHVASIERFRPALKKVTDALGLPDDPALLVRASGAVTIAASLALAKGKAPRLAAFTLAAVATPITLAKYPVWAAHGSIQRQEYLEGALRSAALLGGLLIAGADTAGKPSIGWRVSQARRARAKASAGS
jgi:uncharacterized membrane protein YphA (DoxX/SURF4 family)